MLMQHHITVGAAALVPLNLLLCIMWHAVNEVSHYYTFCPYSWSLTALLNWLFERETVALHMVVTILTLCEEMWFWLQGDLAEQLYWSHDKSCRSILLISLSGQYAFPSSVFLCMPFCSCEGLSCSLCQHWVFWVESPNQRGLKRNRIGGMEGKLWVGVVIAAAHGTNFVWPQNR